MYKKQDMHSLSSSCSSLISSLNSRSPVVTLLIIFSIFLVLFAAGGVHAEEPTISGETNQVLATITPTAPRPSREQ